MRKHIPVVLFSLASMVLSSCSGLIFNEDEHAKNRIEDIISAIEEQDGDKLKNLFSSKALDEVENWEESIAALFMFVEGNITSHSSKQSVSTGTSVEDCEISIRMCYSFYIVTETNRYSVFLIDYPVDTQNKDNKGLYMLEVHDLSYTGKLEAWQDCIKAGISILE